MTADRTAGGGGGRTKAWLRRDGCPDVCLVVDATCREKASTIIIAASEKRDVTTPMKIIARVFFFALAAISAMARLLASTRLARVNSSNSFLRELEAVLCTCS